MPGRRKKNKKRQAANASLTAKPASAGLEYIGIADNFKMPKWMECAWRRVPCNRLECRICGRILRDRQKHVERGEDPDDPKSAFEDVGNTLREALEMVKRDAERMGIDIANTDDIQEPPEPWAFPFYEKVEAWRVPSRKSPRRQIRQAQFGFAPRRLLTFFGT